MNHAELVSFGNAVTALNRAAATNDRFLAHCAGHQSPELGTELQVEGASLSVAFLGHTATALGRHVLGDRGFATEYVFEASAGAPDEPAIEVWRCYVDAVDDGETAGLYQDAALRGKICDALNTRIADHIALAVAKGIKAEMFTPRPPARG